MLDKNLFALANTFFPSGYASDYCTQKRLRKLDISERTVLEHRLKFYPVSQYGSLFGQ